MTGPIVATCWRQAARIRRQSRDIARLSKAYRYAIADRDLLQRDIDGWTSRCASLYLIADPTLRDEVLGVHNAIDWLPTTEDRT